MPLLPTESCLGLGAEDHGKGLPGKEIKAKSPQTQHDREMSACCSPGNLGGQWQDPGTLTPELPNGLIAHPHSHQAGTSADYKLITFVMTLHEEVSESYQATPLVLREAGVLPAGRNHTVGMQGCSQSQENPSNHNHSEKSLHKGNWGEINGKCRRGCPVPEASLLERIGIGGNRYFPGEPQSWGRDQDM